MEKQGKVLSDEIKSIIIGKFVDGKLVNEIIKEMSKEVELSRDEVKNVIENYINDKLTSEEKTK